MNQKICSILLLSLLGGCVQTAVGPSVAVMPAAGKPFDLFVQEESLCRRFAESQVGISSKEAANESFATSAVVGTAVGAAAGTAIGALSGDVGAGAVVGAGSGLMFGSLTGLDAGYASAHDTQNRYDIAYEQCMYAKGNQVPGVITSVPMAAAIPPPPPMR